MCSEPPGFFLLLETTAGTLPLQVTSDPQDAYATTSPQALTVIQLLSGVDMAGPILPPETLAKLLVLSCESIPEPFLEEPQQQVLEVVQKSLWRVRAAAAANVEDTTAATTSSTTTPLLFSETHPWLQSKCQLPQVTLDELILTYRGRSRCGGNDDNPTKKVEGGGTSLHKMSLSDPSQWHCQLQCNVKWIGKMSIHVSSDLIQAVSYQYDDATSMIFTCLALALRYKAPMSLQQQHRHPQQTQEEKEVEEEDHRSHLVFTNHEDLDYYFPTRTTVSNLQQSSTRVTKNIERGFEIHKLQKALEIARKRGDVLAEAKIRAVLDEMDSFHELPVTTQEETEARNGEVDQVDDSSFQ